MTYTRQRRPPPPPAPGVPLAEKLPQPAWKTRDMDAAMAQWAARACYLLSLADAYVIGSDGIGRGVHLIPDFVHIEAGKAYRVQAVIWLTQDDRGNVTHVAGKLFRTMAPARAYFAKITGGR